MRTVVQPRTRQFARVLGPFLAIVMIVALIRVDDMPQLLSEFTTSDVWPWVTGAFVLMGGVAIIASHQIWRGMPAIIVSALGWLLAVRGVLLIAFPGIFAAVADWMIEATVTWMSGFAVMGMVGLYLSYVGWKPDRHQVRRAHLQIDSGLPRAA